MTGRKNKDMLVGKRLTYDVVKQRQKSTGELSPKHVPLSSEFMSLKNNINERPLKSISTDLSLKVFLLRGIINLPRKMIK